MPDTEKPKKPSNDKIAATVKVIAYPLRITIIRKMRASDHPWSPVRMAEDLGLALGNVSYHMRALEKAGAIGEVGTTPRRGALEHFYSPRHRSKAWRQSLEVLDLLSGDAVLTFPEPAPEAGVELATA
jgi:DNA-binding transcriptional ArsR family regulator